MRSLIALLDGGAPSFCCYEVEVDPQAPRMSLEVFRAVLSFAEARELALQVLAGADGVPREVRELLAGRRAVCYVPATAERAAVSADDVVIFDLATADPTCLEPGRQLIAILRVAAGELGGWPDVWAELATRVQRVVVVLRGVDRFTEADIERHADALRRASSVLEEQLLAGRGWELNLLTDRMVLTEPTECGAGIEHLTVAPDGRFFICPGFAADSLIAAGATAVGQLPDEPALANRQLLTRQRAPICALCDAYHCRRCVYLNQRATLELNTPSWQACRVAHLEREASRRLLDKLQQRGQLTGVPAIGELSYDDPLEQITGKKMRQPVVPRPALPEVPLTTSEPRRETTKECSVEQRKPVGQVTPEERDEIRQIFLRKSALAELFLTLLKLDQQSLADNPLYEKLVLDMGETTVRFQSWWDAKALAYGWQGRAGGNWSIDFASCEVFLN